MKYLKKAFQEFELAYAELEKEAKRDNRAIRKLRDVLEQIGGQAIWDKEDLIANDIDPLEGAIYSLNRIEDQADKARQWIENGCSESEITE
jgi:hypothetical protein